MSDPSNASTSASNFSLVSDFDEPIGDGLGLLSSNKKKGLFLHLPTASPGDNLEPPPSPQTSDSYSPSPDFGSAIYTPKPDTPEVPEHAEDDTAVSTRPFKQVDYLSHEWREEDIWSSWRYIVNRSGDFPNKERLENASWRSWMKAKNNLRTVPPETLNWLKDCDVTWLYGPLQPGPKSPKTRQNSSPSIANSSSFVNLKKKPILKKRSMPEDMLQRSLSIASLLKQGTAVVQAQTTKSILRPSIGRATTDTAYSSRRMSKINRSVANSTNESSGVTPPSVERKHVHFNEQVEQYIAVEVKGEDDDEMEPEPLEEDSDSSDGIVMMTRARSRKHSPILKKERKKTQAPEGKTIEMLPAATLKYREDTPEPREPAMKHRIGRSPVVSPCSFKETARPSRNCRFQFFFDEDDDDVVDNLSDANSDWDTDCGNDGSNLHSFASSDSLTDEPAAMRQTPSGMFMPYDEGEADAAVEGGIFGRVVDIYSTVRDITHAMWNVG